MDKAKWCGLSSAPIDQRGSAPRTRLRDLPDHPLARIVVEPGGHDDDDVALRHDEERWPPLPMAENHAGSLLAAQRGTSHQK